VLQIFSFQQKNILVTKKNTLLLKAAAAFAFLYQGSLRHTSIVCKPKLLNSIHGNE